MIKLKKILMIIILFYFIGSFVYATDNVDKNRDIIRIGKDLKVEGVIKRDILIIGGKLDIKGVVKGDVIIIWGKVNLHPGAKIEKDLVLIGSTIINGDKTVVKGKITEFNSIKELNKIYKEYSGKKKNQFFSYNDLLYYLIWLLLLIITYSLIPLKIETISDIIKGNTIKDLIAGIIIYILFIFIIIIFAVMSIFIIGIPFLIAFAFFIFILKVLSRTAMSIILGRGVKEILKLNNLSPILILAIGLLFVLLLKKLPYFGSIIIIILDSVSFGAIYYFYRVKRD